MTEDNMVLRTVYLPANMDDELKRRAYFGGMTKGEIIRAALAEYLARAALQGDGA